MKHQIKKAAAPFKYEYRGCFISKASYGSFWFIHASHSHLSSIPRGVSGKTRKEVIKQIDKYLN